MKKTFALACLFLALSLNACNSSSAGVPESITSPGTGSNPSTSTLSPTETSLVGYWACSRGCEEGVSVSLDLGADRKVAFANVHATTPVTGARTLGTWRTAGDTLILGITSTDQTYDGITWDTLAFQRTQHMLQWLRGDTLRILTSWDTMVFARTAAPRPLTARVSTPLFSQPGSTYSAPITIELSCSTAGATIHYTTDGSVPTSASAVYTQPIAVGGSLTLKAVAIKTGLVNSPKAGASYVIGP